MKKVATSSKKRYLTLLAVPLALAGLALTPSNTLYAELTTQQQLDQGRAQQRQLQADLYDHRHQMSPVQAQIYELHHQILETSASLDDITYHLDNTRDRLETVQAELEEAQLLREEQQLVLAQRARAMYMNGSTTYLEVLLNAADFTDMLVRMELINIIIEHDQNLVTDLLETEARIDVIHTAVVEEEQRFTAAQTMERTALARQESELEAFDVMLSQLEATEQEILRGLRDQERANQQFENMIRRQATMARATGQSNNRIIVEAPENLNGRMLWPVPNSNTISSAFGPRRSPISGRNENHTGIDIPARTGTNIVATESGTVIFQGWQNGFGNTIIIDHGDGIHTLYAHNSQNQVRVGESVQAGQIIGLIGSTGWSTGPHLHYEVRVNGTAINPMNFLN